MVETTEVIKHRAMPVGECPVVSGEIADPDGRQMFRGDMPIRWPGLHYYCTHCIPWTLPKYVPEGQEADYAHPPTPVTCVIITQPADRHLDYWRWQKGKKERHLHMCAPCYRHYFGTE